MVGSRWAWPRGHRRGGCHRSSSPEAAWDGSCAVNRWAALAAGSLVLSNGCGAPGPPLPERPPVVGLTLNEWAINHATAIPRGRVVFEVRNQGQREHRVSLVKLAEDMPPIREQFEGNDRRVVDELAATPNRPPGSRDVFAVNLSPGRWAFICFLIEEDGLSHAKAGMATEFRVA